VLLIAGEGGQLAPLEQEAADLGIEGNVKFLGFRDDIPALLEALDVFVLPSLSEGLPLSILRRWRCKASGRHQRRGVPEIIEDGVTGYLVLLEIRRRWQRRLSPCFAIRGRGEIRNGRPAASRKSLQPGEDGSGVRVTLRARARQTTD